MTQKRHSNDSDSDGALPDLLKASIPSISSRQARAVVLALVLVASIPTTFATPFFGFGNSGTVSAVNSTEDTKNNGVLAAGSSSIYITNKSDGSTIDSLHFQMTPKHLSDLLMASSSVWMVSTTRLHLYNLSSNTKEWSTDSASYHIQGITFSPDGDYIYSTNSFDSIHKLNTSTGNRVWSASNPSNNKDLSAGPDGNVYVATEGV